MDHAYPTGLSAGSSAALPAVIGPDGYRSGLTPEGGCDVEDAVDPDGATAGERWLGGLPDQLDGHRRLLAGLLEWCQREPLAVSLSVGCSLGRGAADPLSDVDAALGVTTAPGTAGAHVVGAVEQAVVDSLPGYGPLVDVLREEVGGTPALVVRRVFAQLHDGRQLDLAVLPDSGIRRGAAAPDFVTLYRAAAPADQPDSPPVDVFPPADTATADQVHDWTFLAWIALADTGKYLRRGSVWEAHHRLNEARDHIWALWAAATGATYPWHGLSQVLDEDPHHLPPGIQATVTGLDVADLRRAAHATAAVLTAVSGLAAATHAAQLPTDMARYVTAHLPGNADLTG